MSRDETVESSREGGPAPPPHDGSPSSRLGRQAHRRIGAELRALYDSVVQQPIPSRFADLIARLDDAEAGSVPDEA